MQQHRNLESLIGTALIDSEFRVALLDSPVAAAADFGLSEEELDVLSSAGASSLEELAGQIYTWIARVPKPRRTASPRWVMEDYQATRVAV